jgi:hypothetical protein
MAHQSPREVGGLIREAVRQILGEEGLLYLS